MVGLSLVFGVGVGCFVNKCLSCLANRVCTNIIGNILVSLAMGLISLFFYTWEDSLQGWISGVVFSAFLIGISLFDYYQGLILNKVMLLMALIGVFIKCFYLNLDGIDVIFSALLGSGFLFLLCWISRGGIGGGDIKFVGVLGIWLGWQSLLLALLVAFVSGAVIGILLICLKRKHRYDTMPFGPFLAVGAFFSYVCGKQFLDVYEALFL